VQLVSTISNLFDHSPQTSGHRQTDRQTDRDKSERDQNYSIALSLEVVFEHSVHSYRLDYIILHYSVSDNMQSNGKIM